MHQNSPIRNPKLLCGNNNMKPSASIKKITSKKEAAAFATLSKPIPLTNVFFHYPITKNWQTLFNVYSCLFPSHAYARKNLAIRNNDFRIQPWKGGKKWLFEYLRMTLASLLPTQHLSNNFNNNLIYF